MERTTWADCSESNLISQLINFNLKNKVVSEEGYIVRNENNVVPEEGYIVRNVNKSKTKGK